MNTTRTPPPNLPLPRLAPHLSNSEPDLQNNAHENSPDHITQRNNKKRRFSGEEVNELSAFKSELMAMMSGFMASQNTRLDTLESHIKEVKTQNVSIHTTNQDIERAMTVMTGDIKTIESKISSLERERKSFSEDLAIIGEKIQDIEKSAIKTSIEIRNVPKKNKESKEDLFGYAVKLCQELSCSTRQADIRDVYRLPSKRENKNASVVIEMNNTLCKSRLLKSIKTFNTQNPTNNLNTGHLGMTGAPQEGIFASEHLTPQTKRLLFLAREFKKTAGYQYVWTTNGRVYLRKKEGAQYILIKNEAQITELQKSLTVK